MRHRLDERRERIRAEQSPTYALDDEATRLVAEPLNGYFPPTSIDVLGERDELIGQLTERFLDHRFDLLGSGWVRVDFALEAKGLDGHVYRPKKPVPDGGGSWLSDQINPANRDEAHRIWQLIELPYAAIDWHVDFKSGFRWSPTTWARDVLYGDDPGVDVKVPWELSRGQHLPVLAQAYALASSGHEIGVEADDCVREFRNQVLDFAATNPPGYGVNWLCTMDVAIRISNWLVAYDLFRAAGATFDESFEQVLRRSVVEHGRHIVTHLEWSDEIRGNHYLADVVGLLFAAAWLPRSAETDVWLAFSVHELGLETQSQFDSDGANFEASTAYHRLSAEMVVYGTAVALSLPQEKREALRVEDSGDVRLPRKLPAGGLSPSEPFPPEHFDRIAGMARFADDVTGPDGRIVQIGDNDSGRFLKLAAAYDDELVEDVLDVRPLVGAVAGLLGETECPIDDPAVRYEFAVVGAMVPARSTNTPAERELLGRSRSAGFAAYPEFGLYVWRRGRLFVTVRCGPIGQNGNGGHAHNDQLSITVHVDGEPLVVDPGTGVYTPLPDVRNRFRSTAMHNTLAVRGGEQQPWRPGREGLFNLLTDANAICLEATPDRFVGVHSGYGSPHRRTLVIGDDFVEGTDEYEGGGTVEIRFHLHPTVEAVVADGGGRLSVSGGSESTLTSVAGQLELQESSMSQAYGRIVPSRSIRLPATGGQVQWRLTVER